MMQTTPAVSPSSQETPSDASATRTFPIDADHAGIRLAVPVLTLVIFFAAYVLASWLLSQMITSVSTGCLVLLAAIGIAALGSIVLEKRLKGVWPSGRTLTLSQNELTLRDTRHRQESKHTIRWHQRVNVLAWRFSVR